MATSYDKLFKVFATNLKKSYPAQKQMRQLGLALNIGIGYNGQGWEHLPHCLIFPLKRQDDRIVGFYGYPTAQADTTERLYVPKKTGFYPRYPHLYTERLLLTENILDAARLWQIPSVWEEYTVLACYSTRGLLRDQQIAIASLKALREVIMFFKSGEALAQRVQEQTTRCRPEVRISKVTVPSGEDVSQFDSDTCLRLLDRRSEVLLTDDHTADHQVSSRSGETQSGTTSTDHDPIDITASTGTLGRPPATGRKRVDGPIKERQSRPTAKALVALTEKNQKKPLSLTALRPTLSQVTLEWIDQQQQQYGITDYELSLQVGKDRNYMYQVRSGKVKVSKGLKAAIWHFFERLRDTIE